MTTVLGSGSIRCGLVTPKTNRLLKRRNKQIRQEFKNCLSARARIQCASKGRKLREEGWRVYATVGENYDVYVAEPTPLQEGETKHTISIFVGDEPGLINRVAGVFGRRGSNIESLAVGLNNNRALFTIVANGSDAMISNLVKQLSKLVKVRYVEDITSAKRVDREMVVIKVQASAGEERTEVIQLCDIFRAKIVDVADTMITACVVGDPGKIAAFEVNMRKFGICELVRTGNISLKRGEALLEPPTPQNGKKKPKKKTTKPAKPKKAVVESEAADVYIVEDDVAGVWDVENVVDSVDQQEESHYRPFTLQLEVDNSPGVLNQVTGVFARRGYNVQSLAVGHSEQEGRSRICMVVPGDDDSISKLIKQLYKLVNVQNITDMTKTPFVEQELMLVKVKCPPEKRIELETLATIFRSSVCDVSFKSITVQIQGRPRKLRAFVEMVEPYGILEVARTGCIAVARESKVDSAFLEHVQRSKIY